jgi:hypothetical protein
MFILALILGGVFLASFLAHTLIIETKPAQLSFVTSYMRSVSILFFVFMVPFYFIRLHQSQEIIHLLAQSRSRTQFLIQTFLAFILYALAVAGLNCLILLVLLSPQAMQWGLSMFFECSIIISLSLFLSTRLHLAAVASLIVLLIYFMGRMHSLLSVSSPITKAIFKLIPALDRFEVLPLLTESILFSLTFLILATLTYQKRWI